MSNAILLIDAQAPTITLAATTTSGGTSAALPAVGATVRIVNEGPNNAYISIGSGAQTATAPPAVAAAATATCTPILATTSAAFRIPDGDATLQIAAITASGTATLRVQVSHGS